MLLDLPKLLFQTFKKILYTVDYEAVLRTKKWGILVQNSGYLKNWKAEEMNNYNYPSPTS